MKLRKDPFFISATLLLFFPLGLFLLFRSNLKTKTKILFSSFGAAANLAFTLFAIFLNPAKPIEDDFQIMISQDALKVGQSSSIVCIGNNSIKEKIQLTADNDCVSINNSIITAEKIGECILTAKAGNQIAEFPIRITADEGGNEIVYLTQNGTRYHRIKEHCKKNILSMTQEEAILSGKTPCKNCY